jgi:hypothetical protein
MLKVDTTSNYLVYTLYNVEEKHDLRRSILAFQFKKCKHMDQKTIVKCVEHRRTLNEILKMNTEPYLRGQI